jgi:hypothetical protein
MARRNPRAKWTLPDVINPTERLCFTIEVPNNLYHIAAFRGALYMLTSAIFWQDDPHHKAKDVALVWQEIYDNVRACIPDNSGNTGILLEDLMSQQIRISPDDPCILQMWCIDHWEDWYNPLQCVASTISQPTNGTPLEAGTCREWDVALRGNEKWLLPLAVNEGDTIAITGATGAWNDGTLGWNCASGHTYALGACVSTDPAVTGDPLMTVEHMRLIMSVDTVFTDAYNTIYAVPSGVTDGQVFFQANDSALDDNSGTVSFHVTVCSEAVAPTGVSFTYDWGSGPSTLDFVSGQERIVSFTATATPGYVNNYGVAAHFSSVLEVSFVSETGFVLVVSGVTWGGVFNMYPTLNPALTAPAQTVPSQLPPNSPGNGFQCNTGSGGAPFTITVKLKMP